MLLLLSKNKEFAMQLGYQDFVVDDCLFTKNFYQSTTFHDYFSRRTFTFSYFLNGNFALSVQGKNNMYLVDRYISASVKVKGNERGNSKTHQPSRNDGKSPGRASSYLKQKKNIISKRKVQKKNKWRKSVNK